MAIQKAIHFDLADIVTILCQPAKHSLARCLLDVTISPGERAAILAEYRRRIGQPDVVPLKTGSAFLTSK
jgi:hypothetical protein